MSRYDDLDREHYQAVLEEFELAERPSLGERLITIGASLFAAGVALTITVFVIVPMLFIAVVLALAIL